MSESNDDFMKNFAMIIPMEPFVIPDMVEDPNGAPIFQGCEAGLCACTGRCKRIIGYSQDLEKIAAHREYVRKYNERKNKPFDYGERRWEGDTQFWEIKKNSND